MPKIEHRSQYLTYIKGNNSVFIWRNLPIYDPKPLLSNIEFEENRSKNAQDWAWKPIFNMIQGQKL